jgi:hypothetical protein
MSRESEEWQSPLLDYLENAGEIVITMPRQHGLSMSMQMMVDLERRTIEALSVPAELLDVPAHGSVADILPHTRRRGE